MYSRPSGPKRRPCRSWPEQRVAHAEAGEHLLANVGLVVAVGVFQQPEVRDVGEVDVVAAHEHARGDAVERVLEAVIVDRRAIGLAVAVGVFDQAQAIGKLGERREVVVVPLLDRREAIFDRLAREIVVDEVIAVADVVHAVPDAAAVEAEGFDDPEAALLIRAHRDGIRQLRLGGEDFRRQSRREREPLDRLGGEVERGRRVGDDQRVALHVIGFVVRCGTRVAGHRERHGRASQ
jgi:hypothetical protein